MFRLVLCAGALVAQAATLPFLTVWRTTAANENITLPFSVPVNNLNISWGDGQSEIVSGTASATHSYSVAGLYNMSIAGDITGFRFNSQGHASKLMEIVSWGDGFIMDSTSTNVFAGCVNLQVSAFASTQPVFVPGATLEGMFMNTKFNSALNWNLTNVTSVAAMFTSAKSLNQSILFSNALGVTSTAGMFQDAIAFNQALTIQTDNVNSMTSMFEGASSFNQIVNFNTGKVQYMSFMFYGASAFNQPINFNGSSLLQVDNMFRNAAAFNQPITLSQTDNVISMMSMFQSASSFNQAVNFNTGKVRYMNSMFYRASVFNQPINFNGSSLLQADTFLSYAVAFNSAVNFTNTPALTSTAGMFYVARAFNKPITFQTDNVTNMDSMFQDANVFNQPVNFNTSNVQSMELMFANAYDFNQPINFDTSSLTNMASMLYWANSFNSSVNFTNTSAVTTTYAMFHGASKFNQPITFQTDSVTTMDYMFYQASSFNQPVPFNTRRVQTMQDMFAFARAFNQPINFDASSLTAADLMFYGATAFNSTVNLTNASSLTSVGAMFQGATAFNQALLFETGNVTNMINMFSGATSFNQPVPFNTGKVQTMNQMFKDATFFNQPINFDGASLVSTNFMFSNATSFNSPVNLTSSVMTDLLASTASMFEGATAFNQALGFGVANVSNMSSMFKGARSFNQALPWPSTHTRNVLSMASMFEDAVSFNQPINFQVDKLVTADNLLRGATSFNQAVVLQGSDSLTSMARMLANATSFTTAEGAGAGGSVNVSSTASVSSMRDMFAGVLGFKQDLRGWNVSSVTDCSNFCYWCGLPSFQQCVPCPMDQILTSVSGMSVCNCPSNEVNISSTQCGPDPAGSVAPTTAAPTTTAPTAPALTDVPTPVGSDICNMVQVGPMLQVECIGEDSSAPSPSPPSPQSYLTGIISPLFNITRSRDDDNNGTSFVFTLPIDPQLYTSVGTITRPCESQQLSCEWQDPQTLEFLRSGCVVSKDRVDMGSGVIGTECTCTHLTVFAIALRSELQLAPLCQAQEVDYVLMALYAILGVGLVTQVTRIVRYQPVTRGRCCVKTDVSPTSRAAVAGAAVAAVQVSLIQHSLLLLVCVLRIVYLAAKPVIGSLAGLVALGLLPSAFALSLFIHLLLTWAGLQLATFEASPFARFRVPFVITTLLVFGVVIVLAAMTGVTPEVAVVRDGSYVLAALYAVVCVLVLLSGLGMRKSIPVVDAVRSMDWRVVFRCRLLVVTLGLSTSLFLAACLWVAAVQTDIVTSSAATLTTTASFYVFDWLSLCVLTWLFSFAVKEATDNRQRGATKDSSRETSGRSNSNSSSRRDNSNSNNSRRNSKKDNYTKPHAVELDA